MMSLEFRRFVVAAKRPMRDQLAPDWVDQIRRIQGVEVFPDQVSSSRIQIAATDAGITRILEQFGDRLTIEDPHAFTTKIKIA